MSFTEKYNGWSNEPTWLVNRFLSKNEDIQKLIDEFISENISDEDNIEIDEWAENLAEVIEDHVETFYFESMENHTSGLISDLWGFVICYIDYYELAQNYLTDYKKK